MSAFIDININNLKNIKSKTQIIENRENYQSSERK
jgi:hypothetical protein